MFAENLKAARKKAELTQKQLAQKIGITEKAYQHYEYGTREPSIKSLCLLSLILNISLDDLLCPDEYQCFLLEPADEC